MKELYKMIHKTDSTGNHQPDRHRGRLTNIMFIVILFMGTTCFAMPEYSIVKVETPPVIDGKLDESVWNKSACASGFTSTNKEWPLQQTSAYIVLDNKNLYFAFCCQLINKNNVKAGRCQNDSTKIFGDESVELFLAPEVEGKVYFHLAFNAMGSHYSASCGASRDTSWNPKLKVATVVSDKKWVLEGCLPLDSIAAGSAIGSRWKLNVGRNCFVPVFGRQVSSWTGQTDFNKKALMGNGVISRKATIDVSLESFDFISGMKLKLRNHLKSKAACDVSISGQKVIFTSPYELSPEETKSISTNMPPSSKERNITLKINGRQVSFQKSALLPFYKIFSITPSKYYITPSADSIDIMFDNQYAHAATVAIALYDPNEQKPLRQKSVDIKESGLGFDLNGLPGGRYTLSAQLLDKNKDVIATDDKVIFMKDAPVQSVLPEKQSIKIKNSFIFLNNKLFFPFMITAKNSLVTQDFFNVKYQNVKTKHHSPFRGSCGLPRRLRRKPITFYEIPDDETIKRKIKQFLASQQKHNSLYANIQYEAQIPLFQKSGNGLKEVPTGTTYSFINTYIKSIFPDVITSIQTDKLEKVAEFANCADIIEVASYQSSYARNPIPKLAEDIHYARTQVGDKPLIWWLGAAIPRPEARTAETIRAATYLALMNGVNGIIYHNGHGGVPETRTRLWSIFPQLRYEVECLYPVISFGKHLPKDTVKVNNKDLRVIARQYNGHLYVIVINTRFETITGQISIHAATKTSNVSVLFETRKVKLSKRAFSDTFTPYEPHVYLLRL